MKTSGSGRPHTRWRRPRVTSGDLGWPPETLPGSGLVSGWRLGLKIHTPSTLTLAMGISTHSVPGSHCTCTWKPCRTLPYTHSCTYSSKRLLIITRFQECQKETYALGSHGGSTIQSEFLLARWPALQPHTQDYNILLRTTTSYSGLHSHTQDYLILTAPTS